MRRRTGWLRSRWGDLGTGARLWWAALAAVAVAVALLGVVTAGADLPAHPQAAGRSGQSTEVPRSPRSPAAPGASGTAMAGMSGAAPASGGGPVGGGVSTSEQICPNVTGADVLANGMVMAPVPKGPPTPAQQAAADRLVAEVSADIPKYATPAIAEADGFTPATNPDGYYVHYLNVATVKAGDVLDPEHPSALMFANTLKGPVLLGAMFLGPAPCEPGPDIGGPLTDWHAHDNLCMSGAEVVGNTDATGTCALGVHKPNTYFMLHVWTAPSIAATYQFQADIPRSALVPIIRTGQA